MATESCFGYQVDILLDYGFDIVDARILRWFSNFKANGGMTTYIDPKENEVYYWVNRAKVLNDNKILQLTEQSITLRLNKLCGLQRINGKVVRDESKEYPLKKILIPNGKDGRMAYYAHTDSYNNFLSKKNIVVKHQEAEREEGERECPTESRDISSKAKEIIKTFVNQEDRLFKHNICKDGENASTTLIEIEKKLMALVSGNFQKQFKLNEDWMNNQDIKTSEILRARNSWNKLKELISEAVKNYADWPNKKVTNFNTWLYNPNTKKSTFLTALSGKNKTRESMQVSNIQEGFDDQTLEILKKAHVSEKDKYVYWSSMKELYDWFKQNWYPLADYNSKTLGETWKVRHISVIFDNYLRFVFFKKKKLEPVQMGRDKQIWQQFLEDFYNSVGLNLDPGDKALEKYRRVIPFQKEATHET